MTKNPLLKYSFVLILIIAILDIVGIIFHLHWAFWWFDTILHFLGGVWVSTTALIFWYRIYGFNETNKLKIIVFAVLSAFVVGFLWEVFEFSFDITSLSDGAVYIRDTVSDLILDTCGGFFASLYSFRIVRKYL